MEALILHLQAPLMSFGGPQIDHIGQTGLFPTLSQVTGLIANALGHTHREATRTQALQDRLSLASALVREGDDLRDFQTVDLGQPHLRTPGWTTRGRTEHRDGGPAARYGTHIRLRHYRADASVLCALSLSPAGREPRLSAVRAALDRPHRPLSIGRKPCLPSTRLVVGMVGHTDSLASALESVPSRFSDRWRQIAARLGDCDELLAEWPLDDGHVAAGVRGATKHRVIDRRDWRNQLHGGERVVVRGLLKLRGDGDPSTGRAP